MSQEREELKQKLKEVLVELENESFKNEVLKELKEAAQKKSSAFQHPAILLILGFLLTTGGGTWLTYYWQGQDQQKQRQELAHERAIQQKYEIADQINKAVAEAYTGTHVALALLSSPKSKPGDKQAAEREAYWNQTNRSWIPTSLVLQQKLSINFKGEKALSLYQQIIDEVENLIVDINENLAASKGARWQPLNATEIKERTDSADAIREHTSQLLKLLVEEIHKEEKSGTGKP